MTFDAENAIIINRKDPYLYGLFHFQEGENQMEAQFSLFDRGYTYPVMPVQQTTRKIIQFPTPPKKNYKHGEKQEVYSIKSKDQLYAMASWMRDNLDKKYLLAFILGINMGLRGGELLSLKWSDIFFPNGSIRYISDDCADTTDRIDVFQQKVSKRRALYLNESCVHAIRWYFGDEEGHYSDEFVFKSRNKNRDHISVDMLRKKIKQAAKACGIQFNVGTHSMRKTFGYYHYESNHDIVFLQRLFGHSSALISMRYIGVADEEDKRAYHAVSIDPLANI